MSPALSKAQPFGAALPELNGIGEAVGGIIVMRPGANALDVIHNVKDRLESIKQGLPSGVEIKTVYDRSKLIEGSVDYLKDKLIEESPDGRPCDLPLPHACTKRTSRHHHHTARHSGCLYDYGRTRHHRQHHVSGRYCNRHWRNGRCLDCHGRKCAQKIGQYETKTQAQKKSKKP